MIAKGKGVFRKEPLRKLEAKTRADEQKSDMRRDTQGRGCTTTGSPVVINYGVLRKSGSYALKVVGVTPGDPMHVPDGT